MTTWEDVVRLASELPEVEAATWYRTPALKVAGKGFARLRTEAEGGLVVMCGHDEKAALLESGDAAFFTTPHGLAAEGAAPAHHLSSPLSMLIRIMS